MYTGHSRSRAYTTRVLLALATLLASTPSQASLISATALYAFSGSASVTDTKASPGASNNHGAALGADVAIQQFDPATGVLIGVTHQLASSRTTTLTGSGSGSGTARASAAVASARLNAPGVEATFGAVTTTSKGCSSAGPCSYAASSAAVATGGSLEVSSQALDAYVGGGTVAATRRAPVLTVTSTGTKPDAHATVTANWVGTLGSHYEYLLHAMPSFDAAAPLSTLTLDFGTVSLDQVLQPMVFSVANLADPDRAALDLDSITGSGDLDRLGTDLANFTGLSAGSLLGYGAFLDTSVAGTFSATYLLSFSDVDIGAAASRRSGMLLSLHLTGEVLAAPSFASRTPGSASSVAAPSSLPLLLSGGLVLAGLRRVRPRNRVATIGSQPVNP